jgi:hypothetical protein
MAGKPMPGKLPKAMQETRVRRVLSIGRNEAIPQCAWTIMKDLFDTGIYGMAGDVKTVEFARAQYRALLSNPKSKKVMADQRGERNEFKQAWVKANVNDGAGGGAGGSREGENHCLGPKADVQEEGNCKRLRVEVMREPKGVRGSALSGPVGDPGLSSWWDSYCDDVTAFVKRVDIDADAELVLIDDVFVAEKSLRVLPFTELRSSRAAELVLMEGVSVADNLVKSRLGVTETVTETVPALPWDSHCDDLDAFLGRLETDSDAELVLIEGTFFAARAWRSLCTSFGAGDFVGRRIRQARQLVNAQCDGGGGEKPPTLVKRNVVVPAAEEGIGSPRLAICDGIVQNPSRPLSLSPGLVADTSSPEDSDFECMYVEVDVEKYANYQQSFFDNIDDKDNIWADLQHWCDT